MSWKPVPLLAPTLARIAFWKRLVVLPRLELGAMIASGTSGPLAALKAFKERETTTKAIGGNILHHAMHVVCEIRKARDHCVLKLDKASHLADGEASFVVRDGGVENE